MGDTMRRRHDSNVPLRHPSLHLQQRVLLRGPQRADDASDNTFTCARVGFGWRCSDHQVRRWKVCSVSRWHNGLCRWLHHRALCVEMSMQLLQLAPSCQMQDARMAIKIYTAWLQGMPW